MLYFQTHESNENHIFRFQQLESRPQIGQEYLHIRMSFKNSSVLVFSILQRLDEALLYNDVEAVTTLNDKLKHKDLCFISSSITKAKETNHRTPCDVFLNATQWALVNVVFQVGYYGLLFQEGCMKRKWGGKKKDELGRLMILNVCRSVEHTVCMCKGTHKIIKMTFSS